MKLIYHSQHIKVAFSCRETVVSFEAYCCRFHWSFFAQWVSYGRSTPTRGKLVSVHREKGEKQFRFVSKTFLGNTRELQSANYRKQAHVSRASRIHCQVSVRVSIYPFLIIFHEYLVMRDATFSWFHDQKN